MTSALAGMTSGAARLSHRRLRLAVTLAGPPPRLVVLARASGLGERRLSLPLGRSHASQDEPGR